jgi:raffinose/stachyose/melibiose transport system substrate-binding protein
MSLPASSRVAPATGRFARRAVVATTAAGLLTALAACGGGTQAASSGSGTTHVSYFSWENQQVMQPIITAFEKANPTIKVDFSYAPPVPQYISTLQTRLRSGTAADVFIITAENKVDLMGNKLVKDLTNEPFMSNLAAAAKATYTKDGAVYGAAVSSWGGGILYNKDLLAKVGFTTPPKTWDDFLTLCQKLKAAGVTPFLEGTDGVPVTVAALVGAKNQELGGTMDEQIWAGKTTFAQTWTEPLTMWSELFTKGLETRSAAALTGDQVNAEFEKGDVAMMTTGSWGLGTIQTAAPKLKIAFMPVGGTTGPYWAGAVSPGYAINAKTKHQAAAEKFIGFLTSQQGVSTYQKETASITTTKDYQPKLDPALSQMVPAVRQGKFYLPQVSWPTNSDALNAEAVAQLQQLAQGNSTPAKAAAALDAKLKSLKG